MHTKNKYSNMIETAGFKQMTDKISSLLIPNLIISPDTPYVNIVAVVLYKKLKMPLFSKLGALTDCDIKIALSLINGEIVSLAGAKLLPKYIKSRNKQKCRLRIILRLYLKLH